MEPKQTVLGIVLFVVFASFQFGVISALQSYGWILGVIIFAVILWLIGRISMPRRAPPQLMELWQFSTILAVAVTVVVSIGYPYLKALNPGVSMGVYESWILGFWLVVFGAAMFLTGWSAKWLVTAAVGIIWAFVAIYFIMGTGGYFYFGLATGFPFIIYGLITKG